MKIHKPNKHIKPELLPTHLAFILDGNGRWATKRGLPRLMGHKKGVETLGSILEYAFSLGIKIISVFAFSTENWKRPKEEIDGIFDILRKFIQEVEAKKEQEQKEQIKSKNIQIRTMGDLTRLPKDLVATINEKCLETKDCNGGILNIALNYGGKSDIVATCNKFLSEKRTVITEQEFKDNLSTKDLPPVDFVIRTGGEYRLSNFMLFQLAYAELYFTKTYWPDFTPKNLDKSLLDFQKRNRKFGNITK